MTILFQSPPNVTIQAGSTTSATFNVPAQFQVPGLEVQFVFQRPTDLPNGTTVVNIQFSGDGGVTFTGNPTTINIPADLSTIHGTTVPIHFSYALGNLAPTNVRYTVDTPAQFTTPVLIQTL